MSLDVQDGSFDEALYERILRELIEGSEVGEAPPRSALLRQHPGHDREIERAFEACRRYRQLEQALGVDASLPSGSRLGAFEVESVIGRGGMGMVYRARQTELGGRAVALKVLPRGSGHERRRFRREARALAGLHHPNLAEVYGSGEQDRWSYFAMQLVEGPTLRDVLEDAAADPGRREESRKQIVGWITDVASALAAVHEQGLVHRDVKPSNIVIEARSGRAVLVDFGLVRPVDPVTETMTGGSPATRAYAPPEQLLGEEVVPASDVFSLGVTLHDLMVGRLPADRLQASLGLEPLRDLDPSVDADLAGVVAQAVDPNRRWRYRDARALHADLTAWQRGGPVSARRSPLVERARRWILRHPRHLVGSMVAVVGLGVLALAWSGIAGIVGGACSAEEALEQGDVGALRDALQRVPALLDPLMFAGEVRESAAAIRRAESEDPLGGVLSALDARDLESAILRAATHLRRSANREAVLEPLVADFLVRQIDDAAEALTSARDWRRDRILFDWAIPLTARMVCEIDRETEATPHAPWRSDLRRAFLRVLSRLQERTENELLSARHYCLTALAGCGEPRDLPTLQRLALDAEDEEFRLGLYVAERIARRAHQQGDLREVSTGWLRSIWEGEEGRPGYGSYALSWFGDVGTATFEQALLEFHFALTLAARAAGLADTLTPELLELELGENPVLQCRLIAAAGDGRTRECMERLDLEHPDTWKALGESAAYAGDPLLADLFRARMPSAEAVADFDRGLEEGRLARRGFKSPDAALDRETLLGSPDEPVRERGAFRVRAEFETPSRLAHRWGRGLETEPVAFWTFGHDPNRSASAEDPIWTGGLQEPDFLTLKWFGASRVELRFRLDRRPVQHRLVLRHQLAKRDFFPLEGQVFLDLSANGHSLGTTRCVRREGEETVINLPEAFLLHGDNEIVVRLNPTTTTTYRLWQAYIERTEEDGGR